MTNKKTLMVSILVILIGTVGMFVHNNLSNSKAVEGTKNIVVTVINENDNYKKEHLYKTQATHLGEALKEIGIVEVQNSQYGDFLVAVDHYKVDESKQQWWKIIVNGKDAETGMDFIMINDNDKFKLILMTGW